MRVPRNTYHTVPSGEATSTSMSNATASGPLRSISAVKRWRHLAVHQAEQRPALAVIALDDLLRQYLGNAVPGNLVVGDCPIEGHDAGSRHRKPEPFGILYGAQRGK
jgi:hypothetical protein